MDQNPLSSMVYHDLRGNSAFLLAFRQFVVVSEVVLAKDWRNCFSVDLLKVVSESKNRDHF
jgi:hypothetical protein